MTLGIRVEAVSIALAAPAFVEIALLQQATPKTLLKEVHDEGERTVSDLLKSNGTPCSPGADDTGITQRNLWAMPSFVWRICDTKITSPMLMVASLTSFSSAGSIKTLSTVLNTA